MEKWKIFIIVGIFIFISIFILVLAFLKIRAKKKIDKNFRKKIHKFLEEIKKLPESQNNQKILEYDKILDMCLYKKTSGLKNKTTGEKMKEFGRSKRGFKNKNKIWSAHKLRNIIAHEIGFQVSQKKFMEAEMSFRQEILRII